MEASPQQQHFLRGCSQEDVKDPFAAISQPLLQPLLPPSLDASPPASSASSRVDEARAERLRRHSAAAALQDCRSFGIRAGSHESLPASRRMHHSSSPCRECRFNRALVRSLSAKSRLSDDCLLQWEMDPCAEQQLPGSISRREECIGHGHEREAWQALRITAQSRPYLGSYGQSPAGAARHAADVAVSQHALRPSSSHVSVRSDCGSESSNDDITNGDIAPSTPQRHPRRSRHSTLSHKRSNSLLVSHIQTVCRLPTLLQIADMKFLSRAGSWFSKGRAMLTCL